MQSRRGSVAVIGVVAISVIVIAAIAAYVYFSKSSLSSQLIDQAQSQSVSSDPELTSTDSVEDIDQDLNSTQVDNLDKDVLGITSQVQ